MHGYDLCEAIDQRAVFGSVRAICDAIDDFESLAVDAEAVVTIAFDRASEAVQCVAPWASRDLRQTIEVPAHADIVVRARSGIPEGERGLDAGAARWNFDGDAVLRRAGLRDTE